MTFPDSPIENRPRSRFFLFRLKGTDKKRLAYGTTPEQARQILGYRLTPAEMKRVIWTDYEELHHQREIPARRGELA